MSNNDNNIQPQNVRLRKRTPQMISNIENARDKRKSEVLIAAQSLDNEIQSVKQLKRLSIGSLDLLIDPELEFRVNNNNNNNNNNTISTSSNDLNSIKRKSWISNSNNTSINNLSDQSLESNDSTIDSDSIVNSSIDVTRAEYLHDESTQNALAEESSTTPSRFTSSSTINSSTTTRHLSGINSLRRGSHNVGTRRTLSANTLTDNEQDEDEDFTNHLLWVPANQHPNVKPENYIELVQDALHNIQIQDSNEDNDNDNNSNQGQNEISLNQNKENLQRRKSNVSNSNNNINNNKKKKKYNRTLVRRPSSLRKSYTELSENSDHTSLDDNEDNKNVVLNMKRNSHSNQRTASLKDITEELTKISNNAGLTNSDAITLARTLSMAGSFTGMDDEALLDDGSNSNLDDNNNNNNILQSQDIKTNNDNSESNSVDEFASKMFMKNGLTIPQRSSLRRSKFNTYRIRSADSTTTTTTTDNTRDTKRHSSDIVQRESLINDDTKTLHMPHSPIAFNNDSPSTIASAESPGSISDLYDHYTQLNKGSKTDLEENSDEDSNILDNDDDEIDTSGPASQDSSLLSSDSVLYRPSQSTNVRGSSNVSLLHENTEALMNNDNTSSYTPLLNNNTTTSRPGNDNNNNNNNNDNWSWSGKSENHHYNDHTNESRDLIDNTHSEANVNLKNRSNHSKNRHKPILNISNTNRNSDFTSNPKITYKTNTVSERPTLKKSSADNIVLAETTEHRSSKAPSSSSSYNGSESNVTTNSEISSHATVLDENKDNNTNIVPKKPSLEEKLVKLFKRRTHRRRSSNSNNQSVTKTNESGVQEELKKKISKFRKHQRKQPTSVNPAVEISPVVDEKQATVPQRIQSHDTSPVHRDNLQSPEPTHSSEDDELPTLQPAVSVTSTKNKEPGSPTIQTDIPGNESGNSPFTETVHELDGDDSQDISANSESIVNTSFKSESSALNLESNKSLDQVDTSADISQATVVAPSQSPVSSSLPPRRLTFADVKRPEKPNAPIKFTDSAFGFPLPELTNSTVIMFDHRLGINVERAIYRLSHLKLSDSKRELRQQVLLSNFMYSYLNLVNHTLYLEQSDANTTGDFDDYNSDEQDIEIEDETNQSSENNANKYQNRAIEGSRNDPRAVTQNGGLLYNGQSSGNSNVEYTTEHNNSNGTILIPDI
ncbi:similar to Saccharomyces cerevisiae YMR273C ZDS1 Protein with a role in regulating Swe1p-dependent polarized growth [Maudiozyma saulgeensis]|uniref:Similar to Saccharomyces cerevisiae YMR273C ZDS1 Protein with a role in regulating Swe1p-dependent polarized growth n=1 Tax=Maudiozyma saulgeensis TaxID=1789683 RepID=A0A1X7R4M1_9SACH|nr:similar to Saccharomyces cerevisiae YMR273C ZDS1 Protein with a role in regulating Swe1p-dependent polarized growth [Kazachstania saulgeensis]